MLDKSIRQGREYRKESYGAKAVDGSCRKHVYGKWRISDRTRKEIRHIVARKDMSGELSVPI